MTLSIVIPLLNEAESLPQLHEWIIKALEEETYKYEVLYIDDGSTDNSWNIISELAEAYPEVKGISFTQNYGKSQALHAGFSAAQGNYVATLDADLQDSPEEIKKMMNLRIYTKAKFQKVVSLYSPQKELEEFQKLKNQA